MFGFYKRHIDYVTDHATDPDSRRYAVAAEAPRHYIDIDHYVPEGEDPSRKYSSNGTWLSRNSRRIHCKPMA